MDKETSRRRTRDSDSHRDRDSSSKHRRRRHHDDNHRRRSKHEEEDHHRRRHREKSADRERSRSVERISRREMSGSEERRSAERNKRKDRSESEERSDKRARVHEESVKENRRFENVSVTDERWGGKMLESDGNLDGESEVTKPDEPSSVLNGVATGQNTTTPINFSATLLTHDAKVISKTNENKGVNNNRSDEGTGKSSTDEKPSDAGKSKTLSLDALAKAKKTLQMHKELAEKMKKIPSLNKDAGSTKGGNPQVGAKGIASLKGGILPTPVTLSNNVSSSVVPSTSLLPHATSTAVVTPPSGLPHLEGLTAQKYEAVKRAQELAAKMGFRRDQEFPPLINMFPGQLPPDVSVQVQPKPSKAPVLRLDALGREIDEHGNVVNVPKVNTLSTLKVNINKQKKDAFQILKPELEVNPEKNPYFDASMGIDKNKLLRPKRMNFQFVEEGKWSKDAEIIKLKSQFGEAKAKELKAKQAQLAKAKSEPDINPNFIEVGERVYTKEKTKESIPDIEWWDTPLLKTAAYGDTVNGKLDESKIKTEKITIYVEHPRPIEPPAEPAPPPPQPLKLTKKEQKKLRTQRRLAREKERQEMIRLGVLEPPKPKVKMSNLMKVLGSEATQDPTKLEMEIRTAAAERERAHVDRNVARKLTPAERREKKERKLFEDPNNLDTIVSVYKVNCLSHPQARFKVDVNAQENRLTGCAVISEGVSVVVVEGGAKSIKRYGKLMLKRIDWAAAVVEEEGDEEVEEKPLNKCVLVWQGTVAKPSFRRFFVQECRTDAAARKFFSDHGVGHYWDLAVNFAEDDAV